MFLKKSQCTFWCRVLTDARPGERSHPLRGSQCTFWCRVLTDLKASEYERLRFLGLNAPSGAGCLPTARRGFDGFRSGVSMHLLVPGAYRRDSCPAGTVVRLKSQCTFWCRVLTDTLRRIFRAAMTFSLNAPSGAGCLPTRSMKTCPRTARSRLNAPSGAGCLPTQTAYPKA